MRRKEDSQKVSGASSLVSPWPLPSENSGAKALNQSPSRCTRAEKVSDVIITVRRRFVLMNPGRMSAPYAKCGILPMASRKVSVSRWVWIWWVEDSAWPVRLVRIFSVTFPLAIIVVKVWRNEWNERVAISRPTPSSVRRVILRNRKSMTSM